MPFKLLCISASLILCLNANAQSIIGKWKTIKSETGEVRSIVEVFEKNGKIYGKVIQIMDEDDRNNLCTDCEGDDKNKKIEGLVLIKDFEKDGDYYINGTITNPENGKVYRSQLWLKDDDPNILNVRGYMGFFYKTMEWKRLRTIK